MDRPADSFPVIRDVGLTGILVTFSDTLTEAANRAALAFRAAVEAEGWPGVEETATSLTSVFLRFDPLTLEHDVFTGRLQGLIADRDWPAVPLPEGRSLWRIPVTLGGSYGPQFEEAAQAAGLSPEDAEASIAAARIRVLTIGFAPGQPYMGQLGPEWDIPRLTELTPRVPQGALIAAIRQLIIFQRPAPTGWRHIGQTAFRCYRPGTPEPFPLTPGDEVTFRLIGPEEYEAILDSDGTGDGGATREVLP
ncbi:MAG: carboxyltransferase domain-containing protein [Rhodobacter sp.]|nr:carboxyltransferase domain-containing protein [Rhodobacter sp.]